MNKETLQAVASATIQEPVVMDVDIKPQSRFFALLQHWGIRPKKRTLIIEPIVLGNLIRISKLLIEVDMNVFDLKDLLESNYQAISKYGDIISRIVAIAIHNKKDAPPKSLEAFISYNFTPQELLSVLGIVVQQMNVTGFMSSIISIKGFSVLESREMSPQTGEIIAPGASLEALQSISDSQ
jgi:hypothetical protein